MAKKYSYSTYPKTLRVGRQCRHLPSHNNFIPGRSILDISLDEAARLIMRFSGKGKPLTKNKERINFKKHIGKYINLDGTECIPTSAGVIHYSKKGAHIVPAKPYKLDENL